MEETFDSHAQIRNNKRTVLVRKKEEKDDTERTITAARFRSSLPLVCHLFEPLHTLSPSVCLCSQPPSSTALITRELMCEFQK